MMSSTPFGAGVPIAGRPVRTGKNKRRAERRKNTITYKPDSLEDAAKTASAELRMQLGEIEAKLKACEVLGTASCPQHQQVLSDQLRLLRDVEAARSPGARLREAKKKLDAANSRQADLKYAVDKLQASMAGLAIELRDTEASYQRAEQEAVPSQQSYDKHLAAMPQGDVKSSPPGSSHPAASNLNDSVRFDILLENGTDSAMSLVSKAVAAATRNPATAVLDAATQ